MKTLRKNLKEMLEIKNAIIEMKNAFDVLSVDSKWPRIIDPKYMLIYTKKRKKRRKRKPISHPRTECQLQKL